MNMSAASEILPSQWAAEINLLHEAAEQHASQAVVYAARCGEKLIQAKASLGHGQWLPWLEANCRVKKSQAAKYMSLAKEMPELLTANFQSTGSLPSLEYAASLLSASEEVKAEIQSRLDAGESVTVREIDQLKRELKQVEATRNQLVQKVDQIEERNRALDLNLAAASEREQRSYRELRETQQRIDELAESKANQAIESVRGDLKSAQDQVESLKQSLHQAEEERKAAIQRGVNYGLAQRQQELNRLERDIQAAENNLDSFRQKLRDISSAEYENQRLNMDAEKVLREIVLFGTTLNLYESDEIFPVNWNLLDQIVLGAQSLTALTEQFKQNRHLSERVVGSSR